MITIYSRNIRNALTFYRRAARVKLESTREVSREKLEDGSWLVVLAGGHRVRVICENATTRFGT